MSSPPPLLFTPNVTRLSDAGCSTGIVQVPPQKVRRISSNEARNSAVLETDMQQISGLQDHMMRNPFFLQPTPFQHSQQLPAIVSALPMGTTTVSPNVLLPQTTSLIAQTQPQSIYPHFPPSGVELFVASAINAAAASIPSIVAAATYNAQTQACPVCVANVCQQPTASTVSACGNCIHHHHTGFQIFSIL